MEIEEAVSLIEEAAVPITDTMTVPLADAYGYILAEDVLAAEPVPSFPRSAMDGYAVSSEEIKDASKDTPVKLKVADEILAGGWSDVTHSPGSAVRVMTGAYIPEGFDAVVMQEDTDLGTDEVQVFVSLPPYRNYCHTGEEIKQGSTVVRAGRRIGRIESGLIASVGMDKVCVRRPARIAIISTGSELREAGQTLKKGQIYNSIRYILASHIREERLELPYEVTCPDDEDVIRKALETALDKADMVITTGGVSVGKRDLIPGILGSVGAKKLFFGVNIQPGTPTAGSVLDGKVILSLSGNPFAAMANFDLYFPYVISKLMGSVSFLPRIGEAELADTYDKVNRLRRLVRAQAIDGKVYLPVSEHMSSVFGNTASCNCYIDIPAGSAVKPGDTVRVRYMPER